MGGIFKICKRIEIIRVFLPFFFMLLGAFPFSSQGSEWQSVVTDIARETHRAKEDAQVTESLIKSEKEKLLAELKSLKSTVNKRENKVKGLKEHFEELRNKEDEMRTKLETDEDEIHTLEGVVRSSAKDADTFVRSSLITPEYPARIETVKVLMNQERFPGLEDIRSLVKVFFDEMNASGKILKRTGKFINRKGKKVEGDILRIGEFMAICRANGSMGCLRYDAKSGYLTTLPGNLSWSIRRVFRKYFNGETDHLPLDLSEGAIFSNSGRNRGISEWLRAGGFLVWPILLIGIVAIALITERLFFLGRVRENTDEIMSKVEGMITEDRLKECQDFCSNHSRFPTCKVLKAGLENIPASREVLENALQEAILRELPRLERFLPTLSVLAAIAPLLGLLGTVTGMINTFQVITQFGTSDPRMMSGGISEALITTQLGLAVAIPILIVHHFLERRVDKVVGDMEEKGTALTVTILKNEKQYGEMVDRTA